MKQVEVRKELARARAGLYRFPWRLIYHGSR